MNVNSISGYNSGTKRNQIPVFNISTVETAFSLVTDTGVTPATLALPLQTSVVGSATPLSINANPSIIGQGAQAYGPVEGSNAPFFNSSSFDLGRPFNIRLIGTTANGAGGITTIKLYLGAAGIVGTAGSVVASVAIPVSTTGNFFLNTQIRWDAVTAAVAGFFSGQVANAAPIAATALTNAVVAASPAALTFVASAVGAAGATGTIQLAEFSIDQV